MFRRIFLNLLLFLAAQVVFSAKAGTEGPTVDGDRIVVNYVSPGNYTKSHERAYVVAVQSDKGLWGFVNKDGKQVISPSYEEIGTPGTCLESYMPQNYGKQKFIRFTTIPVKKKGKWGLVSNAGIEIIKPAYDKILPFVSKYDPYNNETLIYTEAVKKGTPVLIGTDGKELSSGVINYFTHGNESPLGDLYQVDDFIFVIDGQQIIGVNDSEKFSGGEIINGMYIFYGNDTNTQFRYFPSSGKIYRFSLDPSWVYINEEDIVKVDNNGDVLSGYPVVQEYAMMEDENIMILSNGNLGVINKSGKLIIEPKFKNLKNQEYLYTADDPETGKMLLIDAQTGEVKLKGIDGFWTVFHHFDNNWVAGVKKDGKWGIIDRNFNFILAPEYDDMELLRKASSGGKMYLAMTKKGTAGKSLVVTESAATAKEVVPFGIFDDYVNVYETDFVIGKKNGSYGAYCRSGAIIKPGQGTEYEQQGKAIFFAGNTGMVNAFDTQGNYLGSAKITNTAQARQFYNAIKSKAR